MEIVNYLDIGSVGLSVGLVLATIIMILASILGLVLLFIKRI